MARRRAILDYVRAATEASKQLTMVVHDDAVTLTDMDGRTQTLPTDDKRIDTRAENGLIRIATKNHWDGATLVSEVDVEGGPKIIRTYTLSPGGTELHLSTAVDGLGKPINLLRYYERPVESR